MTKVMTTLDELLSEVEDAQEELGFLEEDEVATIVVCHGAPKCDRMPPLDIETGERDMSEWEGCRFCYRFSTDDPRSTDEILADMEKVH